ncbi:hypothetical protein PCASD_16921 [Puccinia coronata f. sp. avenae]|uniref:Uncharacterized protein n=1 Tax=Puccinia coronata f. sp. avenae TaxID=200324 RepID=A0A2N5T514_9BASI|nr:hypothetical protein PCASD_16921 [Puccinia coronata f. sp. avenae]
MAGEQCDRSSEQPSLNARSSSLNQHASQPILPSSSCHLAGKLSGLVQIEQMFDRFKTELAESNQAISDRLGTARDLPGTSIIIDPGTPDPHRVTKPLPNTTRSSFIQPEKQAAANNQSKRASTSYTNPGKQAAKDNHTPSSSKPSSNVFFDEDFFQKMMMFHQLTQRMARPPPQLTPAEPDYSAKLHKWLTLVPKLLADGSNYQSWVIMIQQALEGVLGRCLQITLPNIVLTNTKDLLLCTALLATVTSLKIRVAGEASGWDGLQLISNNFTLRSRLAHLALMRDLLETKFNHLDKMANI